MEVFHYCAEQLKDWDIFETCSDDNIKETRPETGAVYNDFENDPFDILMSDESDLSSNEETYEADGGPKISQKNMDTLFLRADDDDESRWSFTHELFDSFSEVSSECYRQKVFRALKIWDDLEIYNDHIER